MSTRSMYRKACSYSYVLSNGSKFYKDDCHDAFLYYFDKTGGNLFEQPEGFVLRCVKWMNKWRYSNEHHNKTFTPFEDHFFEAHNPHKILEQKEQVDRIYERIKSYRSGYLRSIDPNSLLEVLWYLERGYTVKELSQLMGIGVKVGYYYKRKLKDILMEIKNPFAGSRIKLSKKITRKTFEESDKYKDYKYDPDKDCDFNEFYTIATDGEDYILIRENGKD